MNEFDMITGPNIRYQTDVCDLPSLSAGGEKYQISRGKIVHFFDLLPRSALRF
jgi:hypothetical protein